MPFRSRVTHPILGDGERLQICVHCDHPHHRDDFDPMDARYRFLIRTEKRNKLENAKRNEFGAQRMEFIQMENIAKFTI